MGVVSTLWLMRALLGTFSRRVDFARDAGQSPSTPPDPTPEQTASVVQLGHGVKFGNFLEAPSKGAWSGGRHLEEADFLIIKETGFSLIRVPISWSAHVSSAPNCMIDSAFFSRVDWVVAQAEKIT